jgi:hypothetical protein
MEKLKQNRLDGRPSLVRAEEVMDHDEAMQHAPDTSITKKMRGAGAIFSADTNAEIRLNSVMEDLIHRIVDAKIVGKPLIVGYGGHVVKTGMWGLLARLVAEGIIDMVITTVSGAIHEIELGYMGYTSEDVQSRLIRGEYGMTRDTSDFFHKAVSEGYNDNGHLLGLGNRISYKLAQMAWPRQWDKAGTGPKDGAGQYGILRTAGRTSTHACIIATPGADTIWCDKDCNGEAIGHGSYQDFLSFVTAVCSMSSDGAHGKPGGAYVNIGSAVSLPECFLKAIAVATNQKLDMSGITTAVFDKLRMYRPEHNVVNRPPGIGFYVQGEHTELIPMFYAGLMKAHADVEGGLGRKPVTDVQA